MARFFDVVFHDPILLTAGLVIVATLIILVWALNAWRNTTLGFSAFSSERDENDETSQPSGNSGLFEAHLAEINSQLTEINRRLAEIEKTIGQSKAFDQTLQVPPSPDIEQIFRRIDEKFAGLTQQPNSPLPSENLSLIESKLEGIHKLLIFLTDSGSNSK